MRNSYLSFDSYFLGFFFDLHTFLYMLVIGRIGDDLFQVVVMNNVKEIHYAYSVSFTETINNNLRWKSVKSQQINSET